MCHAYAVARTAYVSYVAPDYDHAADTAPAAPVPRTPVDLKLRIVESLETHQLCASLSQDHAPHAPPAPSPEPHAR